jgi:Flp pilus assembly protein TadG
MNLFRLSGDCLPDSQAAEDRVEIRSMRFSGYLSKSPMMPDGKEWRGMGKTLTWIHGRRHLLCRSRSEEGQSLVEFALVFLVFMLFVFAIFDFGHLFFVEMDVQNAIQEAARYGSTGNHLPDPKNPGNSLSRVTSIIDTLENDAMGVQFSNIQVSSSNGASTSTNGGGPGDMLTVSATVNMSLMTPLIAQMFPNGQYTFTASVTIMNEPFPPSQTQ